MGRLTHAIRIATAAASAGVDVSVGSSGIFGIQDCAYQHLAAIVGLNAPCEDITMLECAEGPAAAFHQFSDRPSVIENPHPIHDGCIQLRPAPGLGVHVDESRLNQFAIEQHTYA